MALHRDIYWVGRQWAVTGYGVQACDQKQKSQFDIEVNRLWEDDVLEGLRAHKWLNIEDFDKAISIARKRFPEPPRKIAPPEDTVAPALPIAPAPPIEPLPQTPKQVATPEAPRPRKVDPVEPPPAPPVAQQAPAIKKPDSEPTKPVPPKFHMLFSGYAKFIRPWRVRMRK
jgi:hypothetical protein